MSRNPLRLILATCALLTGCRDQARDLGTMHIEFLAGNRLTISAVHDGKTWFEATGVRDTIWRAEAKAPDGTGFAWSMKYDLDYETTGLCFVVLDIPLPSRTTPVPANLQVGQWDNSVPPFVWPSFNCFDAESELLEGAERIKEPWIGFIEGTMTLDVSEWPSLVGRLDARIALHTFISW